MRGLILLCLMGLILPAIARPKRSTAGCDPGEYKCQRGLENKDGFNSTTNSTTNSTIDLTRPTQLERADVQWNGTWKPIENTVGFGPPPDDKEDTELPKGDTLPRPTDMTTTPPYNVWVPFEGHGFAPTARNVIEGKQK